MKKLIYVSILSSLMLGNTSCSKEDDFMPNQNLTGSWLLAYDVGHPTDTYREEWTFKDDGAYEYVYKVVEKESGKLLGYNRLNEGAYSVIADTLYLGKTKRYFLDSNELVYTDKETLLAGKAEELEGDSTLIEFKDNATKLVFIYLKCNDVADCVGSREYVRI